MSPEDLKKLRESHLALNEDGDFVFTRITKDGKHTTYGPYNFGDAMRICWMVMDDYKERRRKGKL